MTGHDNKEKTCKTLTDIIDMNFLNKYKVNQITSNSLIVKDRDAGYNMKLKIKSLPG